MPEHARLAASRQRQDLIIPCHNALDSWPASSQRRGFMSSPLKTSIHAGLRGARANLLPGLALQALAVAVVLAYYHVPAVRDALTRLTAFRAEVGVLYAIVATAIFGGVLPSLYLRLRRATRHQYTWTQAAVLTAFWGYKGVEVDLFYQFNAWLIGEGHDVRTIALKTLVDQGVYCPFFAVPTSWFVYAWVSHRFDAGAMRERFRGGSWYAREVLPILVSNAAVWIPAVAIIYL
ncbi:MAG TPA: hypothetical protein VHF69_07815, partial [Candidatus Synoicihabitans sp.]|nr:hypothetical protein [Candidatus Synoicihabitans sp.]